MRYGEIIKLGQEALDRLKADWQSAYSGENAGNTAILEQGIEFKPLSMTNADAQYLETRRFQVGNVIPFITRQCWSYQVSYLYLSILKLCIAKKTKYLKNFGKILKKELVKMQTLPIGVQDFVQLRQDNLLYVDKTARLLELVENGRRYFLSRPRRFGKSLTLSTLGAMFSGRKELFKSLAAVGNQAI